MGALLLNKVNLKYPNFQIKDISFSLKQGEKISILGLSGSGKSSLLSVVYGLLDIDGGEIKFEDEIVEGPSKVLIPGHKKMRLVNQDYALDDYHNVKENISNKILHFEKDAIEERSSKILNVINLNSIQDQKAITLSGGQKQRLSLGRAMAELPDLLLLDEPFSQIDLKNKYEIERKLWSYLHENKMSAIMVTHDYYDAFAFSNRILIMKEGTLFNDTSKKELYEYPKSDYEAVISGGYNVCFIDGKKLNFRNNEFSLSKTSEFSIKIDISITDRVDLGGKEVITCVTEEKETIILESSFKNNIFNSIYIQNKTYSFES